MNASRDKQTQPRLILASASSHRRDLMAEAGYQFDVRPAPPEVEEGIDPEGMDPEELALSLAEAKARAVARDLRAGLVIGADTVVAVKGRILGKPRDRKEARVFLRLLSGSRHEVVTGLCLLEAGGGACSTAAVTTLVFFRRLKDAEIDAYVSSGESDGKAGAYGIQATGDRFVERMEGSFTNVVGLPMETLAEMLQEMTVQGGESEAADDRPGAR
jgi:septum formation protein